MTARDKTLSDFVVNSALAITGPAGLAGSPGTLVAAHRVYYSRTAGCDART